MSASIVFIPTFIVYGQRIMQFFFSYVSIYQDWTLYFVFLFTSHNIFANVTESSNSNIWDRLHFNNSLQIRFQLFVKAVAKVSEFTVQKKFKAFWKFMRKYDIVFFYFIYIYIYLCPYLSISIILRTSPIFYWVVHSDSHGWWFQTFLEDIRRIFSIY